MWADIQVYLPSLNITLCSNCRNMQYSREEYQQIGSIQELDAIYDLTSYTIHAISEYSSTTAPKLKIHDYKHLMVEFWNRFNELCQQIDTIKKENKFLEVTEKILQMASLNDDIVNSPAFIVYKQDEHLRLYQANRITLLQNSQSSIIKSDLENTISWKVVALELKYHTKILQLEQKIEQIQEKLDNQQLSEAPEAPTAPETELDHNHDDVDMGDIFAGDDDY